MLVFCVVLTLFLSSFTVLITLRNFRKAEPKQQKLIFLTLMFLKT